ncbi:hypothetical protein ACWA06_02195 [Serratia rhizosphaerae]|uniref:hypothetical protein n=1 Tax=unclassified Serratia (in: enterobacteria) TaxID=2647522 RepID=UPI001319D24D|nr:MULTISPECIES: hypothetical protein [unclassified Serratia (in: enterobacteria)]MBU3891322.1 hypothetical protein [Serratia rubidaea]MCA4823676.1 hypothetical protein [Serratia rubidaea]QNK30897.1 hypothetical protein HF675_14720 [Serratia sp. JUb9]QPT15194.1 hypothetical protein I6G37_09715 [Serratia rubidaea]CAE1145056.1 conserved exported protein of unknown function [Serratia sp. Tan611]
MPRSKATLILTCIFLSSTLAACAREESAPFTPDPQCQFTHLAGKHITAVQLCADAKTGNTVTVIKDGQAYDVAHIAYTRFQRFKFSADPDAFFSKVIEPNHTVTPYQGSTRPHG